MPFGQRELNREMPEGQRGLGQVGRERSLFSSEIFSIRLLDRPHEIFASGGVLPGDPGFFPGHLPLIGPLSRRLGERSADVLACRVALGVLAVDVSFPAGRVSRVERGDRARISTRGILSELVSQRLGDGQRRVERQHMAPEDVGGQLIERDFPARVVAVGHIFREIFRDGQLLRGRLLLAGRLPWIQELPLSHLLHELRVEPQRVFSLQDILQPDGVLFRPLLRPAFPDVQDQEREDKIEQFHPLFPFEGQRYGRFRAAFCGRVDNNPYIWVNN